MIPCRFAIAGGCFAIAIVMVSSGSAVAQLPGAQSPKATARLLSNAATVTPGQTFRVGLLVTMQPHWHIYWHNPGDAGMATSIDWQLPDGWRASPLHWPVPIRFLQPGDIVGYGYENQVLLMADVTVPADAPTGTFSLAAHAEWLVCKDVCIPGEASPAIEVVVGPTAVAANEDLFGQWADRLPDERGLPSGATVVEAARQPGGTSVVVAFEAAPADVQVFPYTTAGIVLHGVDVTMDPAGKRTTIRLRHDAAEGASPPPVLVVWTDGRGERHAGVHTMD